MFALVWVTPCHISHGHFLSSGDKQLFTLHHLRLPQDIGKIKIKKNQGKKWILLKERSKWNQEYNFYQDNEEDYR